MMFPLHSHYILMVSTIRSYIATNKNRSCQTDDPQFLSILNDSWTKPQIKRNHVAFVASSSIFPVPKSPHFPMISTIIPISPIFPSFLPSFFHHFSIIFHNFSRMRSKGSRFTLGVWGLRVCSTLRLWSQLSATVRNRPYELRMAVPMGSSAEVVIFGDFQCVVASFRVAGVALHDIQTCSATCRKSFCVAGANFCDVFSRCVAVFVAGAALWTCPSSFFVAGAAL